MHAESHWKQLQNRILRPRSIFGWGCGRAQNKCCGVTLSLPSTIDKKSPKMQFLLARNNCDAPLPVDLRSRLLIKFKLGADDGRERNFFDHLQRRFIAQSFFLFSPTSAKRKLNLTSFVCYDYLAVNGEASFSRVCRSATRCIVKN